jgi:hypothetical protein
MSRLTFFSRPSGTFQRVHPNPGLRPGLSSAVPAGLILQSVGFSRLPFGPSIFSARLNLQTASYS